MSLAFSPAPCPECGHDMDRATGRYGKYLACGNPGCNGRRGCTDDWEPLDRDDTHETRQLRIRAHDEFDQLWKHSWRIYQAEGVPEAKRAIMERTARTRAYAWLAESLGIAMDDCHMAKFDGAMCLRVIELSATVTDVDIRAWAQLRKRDASPASEGRATDF